MDGAFSRDQVRISIPFPFLVDTSPCILQLALELSGDFSFRGFLTQPFTAHSHFQRSGVPDAD